MSGEKPREGKGEHSAETHEYIAKEARKAGSTTFRGEERVRQGHGLDPLVDPSAHGVIRLSQNLLIPQGDVFLLKYGVAMAVKGEFDLTLSMADNVNIIFAALPKLLHLLAQGPNAVLRRYHTQIATGAVQDKCDPFAYEISQFEPDNEIDRQLTMLYTERDGGDCTEDYQVGLFSTAFLTRTSIREYGLKGYYFPIGDERGRDCIGGDSRDYERSGALNQAGIDLLVRVFGKTVLEKAFGTSQDQVQLPSTAEIAKKVLEDWHAFFLQVGDYAHTTAWWARLFGRERVIRLPATEYLTEVQACIIGLTEGTLDLQNAADFLVDAAKMNKVAAKKVVAAVSEIPLGAQAAFPNFEKIPMAGAIFASREDIWPIEDHRAAAPAAHRPKPKPPAGGGIEWKL